MNLWDDNDIIILYFYHPTDSSISCRAPGVAKGNIRQWCPMSVSWKEGDPIPDGHRVVIRRDSGYRPPDDDGDDFPEGAGEVVASHLEPIPDPSPVAASTMSSVQHEYDPNDQGHMCC